MIFTYNTIKKMLDFCEEHNRENIYLKVIPDPVSETFLVQTQIDCWNESKEFTDVTDYECEI